MKICIVQQDIAWGDPEANMKHLDGILATAEKADLYLLPEMFTTGFATLPDARVEMEPCAGLAWMQRKAAELDAAIAGSIALEISRQARNDNSVARNDNAAARNDNAAARNDNAAARNDNAVAINDNAVPNDNSVTRHDTSLSFRPSEASGEICANRFFFVFPDGSYTLYDKRHLFGYGGEGERFQAGDQRVTVSWRGVRFLLAVCYDLRFPVWLRNLDDYDALLIVANWPDVRRFAWDTLLRARAIEDTCYVAAANRVGKDPACEYSGGTAFIGPFGETLAQAPEWQEGVIYGEIDLEHLADYHSKFPVLEDADRFVLQV